MPIDEHRAKNLANWNDRVVGHIAPDGYDVEGFVTDPTRLSDVVEFDRGPLGDVRGKSLLHPQCHIGTDTLSWAKLGARVTGFDFSAPALVVARDMAARLGFEASFVETELYDAPQVIDARFDIVYTGVGALNWLPDIRGWARVMAHFTQPGGRFYIRECHPVLWTLDQERDDDLFVMTEPYFERPEPSVWDESESYAGSATVQNSVTHEWNHGLAETLQALIDAGLRIDVVKEHEILDWNSHRAMVKAGAHWVFPEELRGRVPLMFSILATKTPNP